MLMMVNSPVWPTLGRRLIPTNEHAAILSIEAEALLHLGPTAKALMKVPKPFLEWIISDVDKCVTTSHSDESTRVNLTTEQNYTVN